MIYNENTSIPTLDSWACCFYSLHAGGGGGPSYLAPRGTGDTNDVVVFSHFMSQSSMKAYRV